MPAVAVVMEAALTQNLPPVSPEHDLVRQAQDGDRSAFEVLYRRYVDRVYGLCIRLTSDADRAEDLTQEAFIRVWETLRSFRRESKFFTWLHRLTVNVVLMDVRASKRRNRRVFGTDNLSLYDAVEHMTSPGTTMDLEQAIAGLPPQAKLVLFFTILKDTGMKRWEIYSVSRRGPAKPSSTGLESS